MILRAANSSFNPRKVPRESGVYRILFPDGSFYIGSTNNLKRRIVEHILTLEDKEHTNYKVQNKYNEYGITRFEFTYELTEQLKKVEQKLLNEFHGTDGCLNISSIATRPRKKRRRRKHQTK